MRFLFLWLLLTALGDLAAAEPYEFLFNGKPAQGEIISLSGDPKAPAVGDVIQFREYSFVLDGPGHYDLREHEKQPYRLFRVAPDGQETLIACHVSTHYRALTEGELKRDGNPKGTFINPLDDLTPADFAALRGVKIGEWTEKLPDELRRLDLSRCWLNFDLIQWDKPSPILRAIPTATHYLGIREMSTPSTLNLHDLEGLRELRVLRHERLVPDYDLTCLEAMRELRYLDISGGRRTVSRAEALAGLTNLRTLKLEGEQGLRDLAFLRPLTQLRRLEIANSNIEDLSVLADLPQIAVVNAELSSASRLPERAVPSLREFELLGAPAGEKAAAAFQALNPQCNVRYDWEAMLQKALAGADRVRIVGRREFPAMTYDHLLAEEKDAGAIAELVAAFVVDDSFPPFHCMCDGAPWLEFYRGEQLLATVPVQHGFGIRWHGGWPADRVLIRRGQDTLTDWLAHRGIKGPKLELAQKRETDRAGERRREFIQGILPAAAFDQLGKARSVDEAVAALANNLPNAAHRAETYLRLFGGDFGSWSYADGFDDLLKQRLLPSLSSAALCTVKLEPNMQSGNGLGRWLFFEKKWHDWKPEELEKVLEVAARDGLTHPREVNRRKTIIALGEIQTPTARKLLRAVVRGELLPRPLPEGAEAEAGGMVTYTPEPKGLPEKCSDAVLAAIWLARLADADAKPDVQKLLGTLQGEDRAALQQALDAKKE